MACAIIVINSGNEVNGGMDMAIVEVKNVNKNFGKQQVLKNVSFTIEENEIVGFIGPNGAGKSTLMKCLASLVFPDSGEIIINGFDLHKQREKALSSISAMIENPGVFPSSSGYENLMYFAKMQNISKERVEEVIAYTKLGDKINKKAGQYSLGMKQRLGLGIALLSKPKFLILDEPTNGLDPRGIMELREELRFLAKNENISILISSHQLGEIEKVADRIICINKGELLATPKQLHQFDAYRILIEAEDIEKATALTLEGARIHWEKNEAKIQFTSLSLLNDYLALLLKHNVRIQEVCKDVVDIESVYNKIFGESTC